MFKYLITQISHQNLLINYNNYLNHVILFFTFALLLLSLFPMLDCGAIVSNGLNRLFSRYKSTLYLCGLLSGAFTFGRPTFFDITLYGKGSNNAFSLLCLLSTIFNSFLMLSIYFLLSYTLLYCPSTISSLSWLLFP